MEKKFKLYFTLFYTTLILSAVTIGGGYVIVSMMKKQFVDKLRWIDETEIIDIISISQSAPGPLAVNASVLLGYRIGGVGGALVTVLGTVIPPFFIMSIVYLFYNFFITNIVVKTILYGIQIGVAVSICDAVLSMIRAIRKTDKSHFSIIVMIISFAISIIFNINAIFFILGGAILGILYSVFEKYYLKNKG